MAYSRYISDFCIVKTISAFADGKMAYVLFGDGFPLQQRFVLGTNANTKIFHFYRYYTIGCKSTSHTGSRCIAWPCMSGTIKFIETCNSYRLIVSTWCRIWSTTKYGRGTSRCRLNHAILGGIMLASNKIKPHNIHNFYSRIRRRKLEVGYRYHNDCSIAKS